MKKLVVMKEEDITEHLEGHTRKPEPKSEAWYKFWGNKCPVCGATAIIIQDVAED